MNCKSYQAIKELYEYMVQLNKKVISLDDIMKCFECQRQDIDSIISSDDLLFTKELLDSDDMSALMVDRFRKDYAQMTPKEIADNIAEFMKECVSDKEVFEAVPDASYYLNLFEDCDYQFKNLLIEYTDKKTLYEYINGNGKSKDSIIEFLASNVDINSLFEVATSITSDYDKTMLILKATNDRTMEAIEDELIPTVELMLFPLVSDKFFEMQITKAYYSNYPGYPTPENIFTEIEEYRSHLEKINQFKDDESKAKYISKIENKDMKEALLSRIKDKKCRNMVIQSFNKHVDPKMASLDKFAQTAIREFFEDTLGENFTDDKRERLEIVLRRSDVLFQRLEDENCNGLADYVLKKIMISSEYEMELSEYLQTIIHEYSHLLSNINYPCIRSLPNFEIEEGMADLFSELVINNYLEKHKEIEIDGEVIKYDNEMFISESGYDFENAWPRTMLAGLEKNGQDLLAASEYLLGEKHKFMEMILGKDKANSKGNSGYQMPDMVTTMDEIYRSEALDFSEIDYNSIYYSRNHILPLFILQNRLKDKIELVDVIEQGSSYSASEVANLYFEGKKFYEVPVMELQEFIDLLHEQITPQEEFNFGDRSVITDICEYEDNQVKNLTDEEIREHSFEVLCGIYRLFQNRYDMESTDFLEHAVDVAIKEEIRKIHSGEQSKEVTEMKRQEIVSRYEEFILFENDNIMHFLSNYNKACDQTLIIPRFLLKKDGMRDMAKDVDVAMKKGTAASIISKLQKPLKKDTEQK